MNESPPHSSAPDESHRADRHGEPPSLLRRLWLLPRRFLILLVRGYQAIVGPHVPPSCRFTPTCSEYAIEAIDRYGFLKGLILSVWRILRCHPLGGHGYDPPRWFGEH